jgi:hypothetical protein
MSINFKVAATLAVGVASLLSAGQASAADCNGTVRHNVRGTVQCYYLPTVSDGRVTGLQRHVDFHPYQTPYRNGGYGQGATIGGGAWGHHGR